MVGGHHAYPVFVYVKAYNFVFVFSTTNKTRMDYHTGNKNKVISHSKTSLK